MRFPCIYKPAEAEGAPPTPAMMETVGKFIEQSEIRQLHEQPAK